MSPKPFLLTFSAVFAMGCNAGAPPSARAVAPPEGAVTASFAKSQATTAPVAEVSTTQPTSVTASARFDASLLALVRNDAPTDSLSDLATEDRDLISAVIDSLTSFRIALRNESNITATKVAPLLELSEKLGTQIPLELPTLALCRSVTQFGVYDPYEPASFSAGKETPVILYCEIEHFRSDPSADGRFETRLTYEATLFSEGESAISVLNKKPADIVDRCRNKRRDFFLADRLTLPANLPAGRYLLKVTVIDQLANRVAEKTSPVVIAPN